MSVEIVDFDAAVATRKTNEYDDTVAALAKAGEGKAVRVVVKHDGELAKNGELDKAVVRERGRFQEAARHAGYTARVRATEEADGETVFTFTLGDQRKYSERKPKADAAE